MRCATYRKASQAWVVGLRISIQGGRNRMRKRNDSYPVVEPTERNPLKCSIESFISLATDRFTGYIIQSPAKGTFTTFTCSPKRDMTLVILWRQSDNHFALSWHVCYARSVIGSYPSVTAAQFLKTQSYHLNAIKFVVAWRSVRTQGWWLALKEN